MTWWETFLDIPATHPCGFVAAVGAVWVACMLAVARSSWAFPPPPPEELGTGDMGAAARERAAYHDTAEGGLRPLGDPGPRRVGGEVDPASSLKRPV